MSTGPGANSAPAPIPDPDHSSERAQAAHDEPAGAASRPGEGATSARSAQDETGQDAEDGICPPAPSTAAAAGGPAAGADASRPSVAADADRPAPGDASRPSVAAGADRPAAADPADRPVSRHASRPGAALKDTPLTTPRAERGGMFSSLRVRNYRLLATGGIVSNIGTWMSRITQDWLVLSLTGSSAAVGITTAMQFLPMLLFGLYGGLIADRFGKRQVLVCTQIAMGLGGFFLAVLTLTGHVQVWHVYLTAFWTGLVTVVDNPTRQSFVSEMVGPDQVRNAVSLNSANFQSARIIGPAVASVLTAAVGPGWAFLANGLSFLAPLTGLLLMRTGELHEISRTPRGRGQLRDGLRYVRGHPELIWPIVLVGFVGTFGFNFAIWLSAFASDVFHSGVGTYGLFNTTMAVGSVTGALLAARRRSTRLRTLVIAALSFGLLEVAAAWSPSYWLFVPLAVLVGAAGMTTNVTANSFVQLNSDPEMRGRVMSLFMMVFVGGTPLGGPLFGWLADSYGVRISFTIGGLVCAAAAAGVGLMLVRAANLRIKVDLRRGRQHVQIVPKEELATVA